MCVSIDNFNKIYKKKNVHVFYERRLWYAVFDDVELANVIGIFVGKEFERKIRPSELTLIENGSRKERSPLKNSWNLGMKDELKSRQTNKIKILKEYNMIKYTF